jgi:hypothetical protein
MTRTELIIQLLKVAIGLALGAYFVWWSLEVLDRLTPDNDAPTPWSPASLRRTRRNSFDEPFGAPATLRGVTVVLLWHQHGQERAPRRDDGV